MTFSFCIGRRPLNPLIWNCCFYILLFSFSSKVFCQSYHYFDVSIEKENQPKLTYLVFLNIEIDGTSSARIKFIDPATNNEKRVSQTYGDTTTLKMNGNNSSRFLTATNEAIFLEGTEDSSYVKTRIVLEKRIEDNALFYVPEKIEYWNSLGNWEPVQINESKTFNFSDLLKQRELLSFFYQEEEPFFQFLQDSGMRGLNAAERKSKLYLITVANTLDASISQSTLKDYNRVNDLFQSLTKSMNISLVSRGIKDQDFSMRNVRSVLRRIRVHKDDIIVFYFSGHGYRLAEDRSKYPRMSLRTNKDQALSRNNLSLEEVYNHLLRKNAHVTLVIADCCNEKINSPSPSGLDILTPRNSPNLRLNVANCRKMFFPQQRTSIIAGAADVGQLAVGNPALGGFFTNFFTAQLSKSMYSAEGTSSWLKLFSDARERTRRQALTALCGDGRCIQRAAVKVIPPL